MGARAGLEGLAQAASRALAAAFDQSRPLGRFALVHALQAAGTTLVTISLAGSLFFSISPHAATERVLAYLALTAAPFALVGPALSPLLDRGGQARRTSLVAAAAAGSALLCVAMADSLHGLLVFPEAFGVLVLGKLYLVGRAAIVPALAGGADLASANARLAVIASLGGGVAFPVGVGVLGVGAAWVLRLGALAFLAAAVAALRLPGRSTAPAPPRSGAPLGAAGGAAEPSRGRRAGPGRRPGRAATRRGSGVRGAVEAMTVARAAVGFVAFFLAFSLRRSHTPTWWFGLLLVTSGAGALLGSLVVPRLRRFLSEHQILEAALAAMAAGALAAALSGGRPAQAGLTFVVGFGPTSAKAALDSLVQRNVPTWALGRTFGRIETRLQLAWVLAAILGVVVPVPLRLGDLVVALACAAAAVSYAAGETRRRRTAMGLAP